MPGQRVVTNTGDIDSLQLPVNVQVGDGEDAAFFAQAIVFPGGNVTQPSEGVVQVDVGGGGSGVVLTDGTHTVDGATQITVTGGTVGGSTPDATLTITGGGGNLTVGNVSNVGNIQVGSGLEVTGSTGTATISATGGSGTLTGVTTDEATQLGNLGPPAGNLGPNTVIIGSGAGAAAETSLTGTVIIGADAAPNLTTGSSSTVVGANALSSLTSGGSGTTAVGAGAGSALTAGEANTFLGVSAGYLLASGNSNVFVGVSAGSNLNSGTGNVLVGPGITAPNATGSNQTNINNLLTSDGAGNISLSGLLDTDPHVDGSWYLATVGNLTVVAQSQG